MSFLLYIVQHFATRGSSEQLSDFVKANILGFGSNKTCREVLLALAPSLEVACGFRYDSNHRDRLFIYLAENL